MNNTQTTTTTAVPNQQGAPTQSLIGSFAPIFLMIFAFYFLMIRPQQKRDSKKREMLSKLRRGDRVVTASGIIGNVHKVISEDEVSLEVAEGVRVRVLKSAITNLLDKNDSLGNDTKNSELSEDAEISEETSEEDSEKKSGKKVSAKSSSVKKTSKVAAKSKVSMMKKKK